MCDINNTIMNFPEVKQELSFGHAQGLRLHIKTVFGEREHPCKICDKSFGESGNPRKDIQPVCEGDRTHQCNICDKSFGESGNPRKHMKERGYINVKIVTKALVRVVTLESTYSLYMEERGSISVTFVTKAVVRVLTLESTYNLYMKERGSINAKIWDNLLRVVALEST